MESSKVVCFVLILFCNNNVALADSTASSTVGIIKTAGPMPDQPVFVANRSDVDMAALKTWADDCGAAVTQQSIPSPQGDLLTVLVVLAFE